MRKPEGEERIGWRLYGASVPARARVCVCSGRGKLPKGERGGSRVRVQEEKEREEARELGCRTGKCSHAWVSVCMHISRGRRKPGG
jgi:hypothetical protein